MAKKGGNSSANGMINPADVPRQTKRSGAMPKNRCLAWLYGLKVVDAVLLTVLFLVVLTGLVFALLWWKQRNNINYLQSSFQEPQSTCADDAVCLHASARVFNNLNRNLDTVKPCPNFYQYACGGFQERNAQPDPITGVTSSISVLNDRKNADLLNILTGERNSELSALFESDPGFKVIFDQMLNYYAACTENVISNLLIYTGTENPSSSDVVAKVQELTDYIKNDITTKFPDTVSLFDIQTNLWKTSPATIAQSRGDDVYGVGILPSGFFDIFVYDVYSPSIQPAAFIKAPVLPYDYLGEYFGDTAYLANLKTLLSTFAAISPDLASDVRIFEGVLKSLPRPSEPYLVVNTTWPSYTVSGLDAAFPNLVGPSWAAYLKEIGLPESLANDNSGFKLYVPNDGYLSALNTLFADTNNAEKIRNFSKYVRILHYGALGRYHGIDHPLLDFKELYLLDAYQSTISVGSTLIKHSDKMKLIKEGVMPRGKLRVADESLGPINIERLKMQKEGVTTATTIADSLTENICLKEANEKYSILIATVFNQLVVKKPVLDSVVKVAANVKAEMRSKLSTASWIKTSTSRANLLTKLDLLAFYIGIPDELTVSVTKSAFKNIPTEGVTASNFFTSAVALVQNLNTQRLSLFALPADTATLIINQDWTEVNGYYYPMYNKVVVPMGFMHPAIYSQDTGVPLAYGSIGFIIGHELSHAFQVSDILMAYDEYGRFVDYVGQTTKDEYLGRLSCFSAQYAKYTFGGIPVSDRTIDQNVADNGGLMVAYSAMKKALTATDNKQVVLPGLNKVSPGSLFWIGWAQTWCSVMSSTALLNQHTTDTHAIPDIRVNAAVSLITEFYIDFGCTLTQTAKDSMCAVWN